VRIKDEFGIDAELASGERGGYDVTLDGRMIYTNADNRGTIPDDDEVIELLHRAGL
jgi:hypothetical protein